MQTPRLPSSFQEAKGSVQQILDVAQAAFCADAQTALNRAGDTNALPAANTQVPSTVPTAFIFQSPGLPKDKQPNCSQLHS